MKKLLISMFGILIFTACGPKIPEVVIEDPEVELIYEGEACGRTVVSIQENYFLLQGSGMHRITPDWQEVSRSCQVRVMDGLIETK